MKIHVVKFLRFWNYTIADYIPCWYPGCNRRADDIMHVEPKGMGGRASVEYIENYCPGCRQHHDKTGGNPEQKEILQRVVVEKIQKEKPSHQWSEGFKQTAYYRNHIAAS